MSFPGQRTLQDLQRGTPGHRFRKHYDAAHRPGNELSVLHRILRFVIALVAVIVGIVLTFMPGPAVLFFALAGALLASESRWLAGALDLTELKLRDAARWSLRRWVSLGWLGRTIVVLVATGGTLGCFALVCWFYFVR